MSRPRARLFSLALCLALAGLPAVGWSAEKDPRGHAKRLTSEGIAAYKSKKYAQAIEKFNAAYKLAPAAPLLLSLSRAEVKLGRCADAYQHATEFKEKGGPASQDSAEAWLATLETECIASEVDSTPDGATIAIDGEPTSPDRTPWKGHLSIGTHQVLLTNPGYQDLNAPLEVTAEAPAKLSLTMIPVATPGVTTTAPTTGSSAKKTLPPGALAPRPAESAGAPMSWQHMVGWGAAALGVATLGVGIGLGVVARNQQNEVRTTLHPAATNVSIEKSSNSFAAGADAALTIGGVFAAAGAGLIVVF